MMAVDDRPLVTFALFAYNQERYIREAVEGAFSQTYEPLEIILSDDYSRDRTFEIIQEMVQNYCGPHRVIPRRSPHNRGLANHINDVSTIADSNIIIVAAGDDVSLPNRTSLVASVFRKDINCRAVFSDSIDDELASLNIPYNGPVVSKSVPVFRLIMGAGGAGRGATYAYSRQSILDPWPIPAGILSEDKILPLRSALYGHVYKIDAPLIRYRSHDQSLGKQITRKGLRARNSPLHWEEINKTIATCASAGHVGWFAKYIYLIESRVISSIHLSDVTNGGRRRAGTIAGLTLLAIRAINRLIPVRNIMINVRDLV